MKSRATFMVSRLLKLLDRQISEVRTENICGSGNPSWVESETQILYTHYEFVSALPTVPAAFAACPTVSAAAATSGPINGISAV